MSLELYSTPLPVQNKLKGYGAIKRRAFLEKGTSALSANMASIYIYNLKGGKCVELSSSQIGEEDIARLKRMLPPHIEGLAFESPFEKFDEESISELRVEARDSRIGEYLKGIGKKLEQLKQIHGAVGFYDLAFRVSRHTDLLMMKARALTQVGQMDQAERTLKRYLQRHPEAPEPYFLFGKNALSRNDYQGALSNFSEAKNRLRLNNVEHKTLGEILEVYIRFVSIYLDRDKLFTRDLSSKECIQEIQGLRSRAQALCLDIQQKNQSELEGMYFFLENQGKIFEKWLEEMTRR